MLHFILFIGLACSQSNRIPAPCKAKCKLDLTACRASTPPQTDSEWLSTSQKVSSCVCNALHSDTECYQCIVTKAPSASIYWTQFETGCTQNNAAQLVANLFGIHLTVPIGKEPGTDGDSGSNFVKPQGNARQNTMSVLAVLLPLILI